MIKDLRNSVNQLTESEAKSVLLHLIIRLKMVHESNESPKEMIDDLYVTYNKFLKITQHKKTMVREYKAVHIVCGESSAGSLRGGLGSEHKVIGVPDFFAVGPIWELHKEAGQKQRDEWLRDHLNYPDDYMEEYEMRFSKTLEEINAIPEDIPIVIWTAENAGEQAGIRYLLYLLKEKTNEVFLINTTIAYQELFNTNEFQYFYGQTGEVHPQKLNTIYQTKLTKPLTNEERARFETDWITLSSTKGILRIWESNKIKEVNEDYFDSVIVTAARQLHAKQKEKDFIKAGRLIGEVLGRLGNPVGDAYLEYRLRSLLYNGVFEIKGIPKGMRYYSVKLR
ncbi:DUF1835 domain-containing protein [Bacillus litorisediminis]|uniref:DUF1835 domain-containing protein n=1 Tax=Bacillus litorisediminis TaxID=2922713 RepID=UPI001FAF8C22|nr:DUF1835 domain-containing protein [Bacillus litorisediminis]